MKNLICPSSSSLFIIECNIVHWHSTSTHFSVTTWETVLNILALAHLDSAFLPQEMSPPVKHKHQPQVTYTMYSCWSILKHYKLNFWLSFDKDKQKNKKTIRSPSQVPHWMTTTDNNGTIYVHFHLVGKHMRTPPSVCIQCGFTQMPINDRSNNEWLFLHPPVILVSLSWSNNCWSNCSFFRVVAVLAAPWKLACKRRPP